MINNQYYRRKNCRQCGSRQLSSAIKLNSTPLANNYLKNKNENYKNDLFPLEVFFCDNCKHLQLIDVVDPKILYENYLYVSGTSKVFIEHFKNYATYLSEKYCAKGLVVDIGSNDGTLLKEFKKLGYSVLGIEPARDIGKQASSEGIETILDFFNPSLSSSIKSQYGLAKIITANNVFAHIDKPKSFLEGIKCLLSPEEGIFVFEVSYFKDVIDNIYFDTIYHEHLDYHTLLPLKNLMDRSGFEVIEASCIKTHGGSIRVISQMKGGKYSVNSSVNKLIKDEEKLGLHNLSTYKSFSSRIDKIGKELKQTLLEIKLKGKTIAAYGAPAKATTLMHHFDIGSETIDFIVDDSKWKQFLFSPGKNIPIYPKEFIELKKPDYILILAWNFAESIIKNNQEFKSMGGKFIIPLPTVEIV